MCEENQTENSCEESAGESVLRLNRKNTDGSWTHRVFTVIPDTKLTPYDSVCLSERSNECFDEYKIIRLESGNFIVTESSSLYPPENCLVTLQYITLVNLEHLPRKQTKQKASANKSEEQTIPENKTQPETSFISCSLHFSGIEVSDPDSLIDSIDTAAALEIIVPQVLNSALRSLPEGIRSTTLKGVKYELKANPTGYVLECSKVQTHVDILTTGKLQQIESIKIDGCVLDSVKGLRNSFTFTWKTEASIDEKEKWLIRLFLSTLAFSDEKTIESIIRLKEIVFNYSHKVRVVEAGDISGIVFIQLAFSED